MDAHGSHGQQHHAQHQRRETERVVRNPRMGFHEEKEHAQHHADHKKPKVRVLVEYLDLPEAECEEQAHARADEQKRHDGGELEAGHPERAGKEETVQEQQDGERLVGGEANEKRRLLPHIVDNFTHAAKASNLSLHMDPPDIHRLREQTHSPTSNRLYSPRSRHWRVYLNPLEKHLILMG